MEEKHKRRTNPFFEKMIRGSYVIVLRLDKKLRVKVGKLGELLFDSGYYIYTGSALNGVENRLRRHFTENKKVLWHIDYLTSVRKPEYAITVPNERIECRLAGILSGLFKSVRGFGSSDCNCSSHLFYTEENPENHIREILRKNFNASSERLIYYTEKDLISNNRW
ncbi:MAG TPA: GIY-YIG nuclease family protein [Archaeoglobaceae archaeon]|nr:GIY-YIG nuclease family protein [Archaeoglobaceae archaeon]